ncbi:ammonia channel protein [Pseudoxanthomonas broegbernensis]|uniref:Ammonium transporter n=1 Tax=Pseudoxanthomonas broegbernensis TaxID=83619 RepID=A0A7V8GNG3_9GAMM|nr:ammonium transporter [Pseudoxanthomonas broegbernensis]KAF1686969.1 ammonia channel protein [Pseudoxanthomonas broegbernensis]MBB6065422.1 Amt family ammonium transporter [Pseudoxanthomonas broegbernensis]
MKTRFLAGYQARCRTLCAWFLLAAILAGVASLPVLAQEAAAPAAEAAALYATPYAAEPPAAWATDADVAVPEEAAAAFDSGNVAWMLTSTLLVLLMVVPGLALFYGGMVRAKNVLSVLLQVLVVYSLVVLLWVAYGYSAAFTDGNAFFGSFTQKAFLRGIAPDTDAGGLPEFLFVAFQSTFAGITAALIVGAFAERIKFKAMLLFSALWVTLAYLPMVHMVWSGENGFLAHKGVIDFAGGTVVHINAGVAGLVGAWFLGRRLGYGREAIKPHSVPYTFVGAALLWVGWFGFNAGSALAADAAASLAMLNTMVATAAGVLGWTLVEAIVKGKPSALGGASGAIAGLVGITPAAGSVGPMGAIVIGLCAGTLCVWGVNGLKRLLGADDSLDVFGVHGIGGIVGALLTGVFSDASLGGTGIDGSIAAQVGAQAFSVLFTIAWCAVATAIAILVTKVLVGLRVSEEVEREGLDISAHGERAYEA